MTDRAEALVSRMSVGHWMLVEDTWCVVSLVRSPGHPLGECEVLRKAEAPEALNIRWEEGGWKFLRPASPVHPSRRGRLSIALYVLKARTQAVPQRPCAA